MKKVLLAAAVIVLAGTVIYQLVLSSGQAEAANAGSHPSSPPKTKVRDVASLARGQAGARNDKPTLDRRKNLERLKRQWLEVGGGNDTVPKQDALAKTSAKLLMCSREIVELLEFLNEHEFRYGASKIESEVEALFATSRAAEARQLLVELPETAVIGGERSYQAGDEPYRDRWSNAAGKTCPDDEFEAFRTALNCESCAQEALYGRNLRLMESDPMAAFTSSLDALRSGVPSISGRYGVTRLFETHVPASFDWAAAEALLDVGAWPHFEMPPLPGFDQPLPEIRRKLFWNWAKADPTAAANHVIAHPDRLDPKLMESVIGGYSYEDRGGIIPWVSGFPDGPYFDHAAASAAIYARGSSDIQDLIQRIQDRELREKALEQVKIPLANPDTR